MSNLKYSNSLGGDLVRLLVRVYGDESRQTGAKYMVLGAMWIDPAWEEVLVNDCMDFRNRTGMYHQLKWKKVSDQKLEEYKEFIDIFFRHNQQHHVAFRCIVINTHQLDHKTFNKGDEELGFYKFYYQLLLHNMQPWNRYLIMLDDRKTRKKTRLPTLKIVLNRGIRKKFNLECDIVRNVEPRECEELNQIQMVDILIGAIGYRLNDLHLKAGAKMAKIKLSEYIADKSGKGSFGPQKGVIDPWFNIWHMKLKKRKSASTPSQ
ncbi:MAG TPA: DUF3800 domain-containing protein [Firmicutes bacterium]|nr:DUF3800 domain-containing protein [Bacillota bacterium]